MTPSFNRLQMVTSIDSRLPTELLGQIFLYCLPGDRRPPGENDAPLLLCSVSSSWRDLAISQPELWSSISVVYELGALRPHLKLIKLWLERSGSTLLSLKLEMRYANYRTPKEELRATNQVLKLFIPEYDRWKRIHLVLHRPNQHSLEHIPTRHSSNLAHVHVELNAPGRFLPSLHRLCENAECLRSLTWIAGEEAAPKLVESKFSAAKLTKLHLEAMISLDECMTLLSTAPELERCHFEYIATVDAPGVGRSKIPLALPALAYLRIETVVDVSPLLDLLTIPSIKHLMIANVSDHTGPTCTMGLSALFLRSQSSPLSLDLENLHVNESELIFTLELIPTLLTLSVTDEGTFPPLLTDRILLCLSDTTDNVVCPNLQEINLHGGLASSDGTLARMVVRRQVASISRRVAPLGAVHAGFLGTEHSTDFLAFKRLKKRGLQGRLFARAP